MRIAFVGKGGSGKSTLSNLYAQYLFENKIFESSLLIDADHNQHLKMFCDNHIQNIRAKNIEDIIKNFDTIGNIKTSLPKREKNVFSVKDFIQKFETDIIYSGNFDASRTGSGCYHGQIGKIESVLTHIIDTKKDVILSDMTAGSDIFGSSYFIHFDLIVIVCEPTFESLSVAREIQDLLKKYNVEYKIVANKVFDDEDKKFIFSHLNAHDILGFIQYQRLRDKNDTIQIDTKIFEDLSDYLKNIGKNWTNFQKNLAMFHKKNILSWADGVSDHQKDFSYEQIAARLEG